MFNKIFLTNINFKNALHTILIKNKVYTNYEFCNMLLLGCIKDFNLIKIYFVHLNLFFFNIFNDSYIHICFLKVNFLIAEYYNRNNSSHNNI